MARGESSRERPFASLVGRITAMPTHRARRMVRRPAPVVHHEVPAAPVRDLSSEDAVTAVPWPLRVAAAWGWRLIVVAAAAVGLAWVAMQLSVIVLPIALALLLTVLLQPLVSWLQTSVRLPRTAAAAVGLLVSLALVVALLSQATSGILERMPDLFASASTGLERLLGWLHTGPLGLEQAYVESVQTRVETEVTGWLKANTTFVANSALSFTSSLAAVLSGLLITLFCLFFFLKDGRRLWIWVVRLCPQGARESVHEAAIRGWVTLGGYVRTQIKVAAIDAAGIGIGAALLGVPMVVPIMVLVFFGSFVPILGALTSGAIAVLVALVDEGPIPGLIMLVIILAVQQFEGNVLHPWLMSQAVSLHPVAVLLVVAGAGTVAGIPGALFGVPIAAFINATVLYLHGHDPLPHLRTQEDRPGGPPGSLARLVAESYRPDPEPVGAVIMEGLIDGAASLAEAGAEAVRSEVAEARAGAGSEPVPSVDPVPEDRVSARAADDDEEGASSVAGGEGEDPSRG